MNRRAWLPVGAVFALLAWWLTHLHYNGPMIDEAFYAQAPTVGNVFYLTADVRLWPTLSRALHALGGVAAARAATAVLVTAAGLLLTLWIREWELLRALPSALRDARRHVAWIACGCFLLAPSVELIATFATCDALALCICAGGSVVLWSGLRRRSAYWLCGGVALLWLAAATRYFYIGPVGLLLALACGVAWVRGTARWGMAWIVGASLVCVVPYLLTTGDHLWESITHARMDAHRYGSGDTIVGVLEETAALLHVYGVVWMIGAIAWIQSCWSARRLRWLVLAYVVVSAAPVVYHLINGSALNMDRDLAVWAWLAALPSALAIARVWRRTERQAIIGVVVGLLLWWGALVQVRAYRQWPDWRPVMAVLRQLPMTATTTVWGAAFHPFAGESPRTRMRLWRQPANIWYLRAALPAQVDVASPWRFESNVDLLAAAERERIDYIVGEIWEYAHPVGARIGAYVVQSVIDVPRSDPVVVLQRATP